VSISVIINISKSPKTHQNWRKLLLQKVSKNVIYINRLIKIKDEFLFCDGTKTTFGATWQNKNGGCIL